MSRARVYTPETLAIMQRFFIALEQCASNKRIKSINNYCEEHNINKRHLYEQSQN